MTVRFPHPGLKCLVPNTMQKEKKLSTKCINTLSKNQYDQYVDYTYVKGKKHSCDL